MPRKPPTPCSQTGCPRLSYARFCEPHQSEDRKRMDAGRDPSVRRDYGGKEWRAIRAAFLEAHPWCSTRGCPDPATDVDHVVSRRRGGSDRDENFQSLCHSCHSSKTAKEDGGFGNTTSGPAFTIGSEDVTCP